MKRPAKVLGVSGRMIYNLAGIRYGKLTAIEQACGYGSTFWKCQCACGRVRNFSHTTLRQQKAHSCGHCTTPRLTIPKYGVTRV